MLIDALRLQGVEILGAADVEPEKKGQLILGVPIIGSDEDILVYSPQSIRLVNAIGTVQVDYLRRSIFEAFKKKGYQFESVIHPSAIISREVKLAEGVQVMAGAILQAGCQVEENTIINTGASVDHDSLIGRNVHVAPGATLSGAVSVGEGSHIGAGAVVIQGIQIGQNCLVAAGAVVTSNVPNGVAVAGVPAREIASKARATQSAL